MGKVTWRGWVTDPEEIAKANMVTPLGPLTLRDGKQVIVLTYGPDSRSQAARNDQRSVSQQVVSADQ